MLVIEFREMGIDTDTTDFVTDMAQGLIADVEAVADERGLRRVESDLGRLQVVVHQAVKRSPSHDSSVGDGTAGNRMGGPNLG